MKFNKYLKEEMPKGGRQHTSASLKAFSKRKKKEYEDYIEAHNDPNSRFNKSLKQVEENKPEWTKLEGQDILRVKGSNLAALPATGKKNAANFVVFDINTRKEITYLKKTEVYSWLTKAAIRGE